MFLLLRPDLLRAFSILFSRKHPTLRAQGMSRKFGCLGLKGEGRLPPTQLRSLSSTRVHERSPERKAQGSPQVGV